MQCSFNCPFCNKRLVLYDSKKVAYCKFHFRGIQATSYSCEFSENTLLTESFFIEINDRKFYIVNNFILNKCVVEESVLIQRDKYLLSQKKDVITFDFVIKAGEKFKEKFITYMTFA